MTILDAAGQLATDFAPTTPHDGTILFPTTYYDNRVAADIGAGGLVSLTILVTTTATGATNTTEFYLVGNPSDTTFVTGNVIIYRSPAPVTVATLVKGYQVQVKVPPGFPTCRYYTLGVGLNTADLSAGKFSAWLANDDFQTVKTTYPAGYTVV
jgi:hypothetical protein